MLTLTAAYDKSPQHTLTLTAGQTSEVILADQRTGPRPSVVLHPNPIGTGQVQATLSSVQDIEAGTARWVPWPSGTVAVTTLDVIVASFTALRAVCLTGAIVVEVKA